MELDRLQNRNLLDANGAKTYFSRQSLLSKMTQNTRWKKPVLKPTGIDSVKPVVSGLKPINTQSPATIPKNQITTLSLELKLADTKPKNRIKSLLNSVKIGFGDSSYFEPETKSFKYQLLRWFSLNWFVLSSFLALVASFSLVILLIFRS